MVIVCDDKTCKFNRERECTCNLIFIEGGKCRCRDAVQPVIQSREGVEDNPSVSGADSSAIPPPSSMVPLPLHKGGCEREPLGVDKAFGEVVRAYEGNIGMITHTVADKIEDWLRDVDKSLILYAIEAAAVQNKPSWAYIEAILQKNFKAGRKTREAAEGVKRGSKEVKDSGYQPDDMAKLEREMRLARARKEVFNVPDEKIGD